MKGQLMTTLKLPTSWNYSTSMYRKWTCKDCGFSIEGSTSYRLFRKAWDANHLTKHNANA